MNHYRTLAPSLLMASLLVFLAIPAVASTQTHKCSATEAYGDMMGHSGERMEQRHKKLHEALKLTSGQEGAWNKMMETEPSMAKPNPQMHDDMVKMTTPERAEKMLAHMKEQQARMTDHVAAITGLYAELNPEQKKMFDDFHVSQHAGKHGKHGDPMHHADSTDKKMPSNTDETSKPSKEKATATPSKHEPAGAYIDDSVITTKVKAAVLNEPTLKSAEINVETYKGVVQLTGFVSSQASINKAAEIARNVKGVTSVKNDMIVKGKQ
jgi:hypothetical protein